MLMLVEWIAYGVLVGLLARWIFPARKHGWKSSGIVFAVGGGLVGNLLFKGNPFAMQPIAWVGVGCGSLFVLGYALLLRGEVTVRMRDQKGVEADRPAEAATKPIVTHEPTPPRY